MWRYLRRFYARFAHVYVPTPSMIARLEVRGFGADNLRIWERGVDLARFHPTPRGAEQRRRWGIGPQERVVLFAGRLFREKGTELLTGGLTRLMRKGPTHRVVIAGAGPREPALRAALPHAVFTGHLEQSELALAYAAADVFVYPSQTDTFGAVTLEAMASGLPVVGVDAPGTRSLVVDGETGWLSRPDPESLGCHLDRLLRAPELGRKMGCAGLERARRYTWGRALARLSAHYDDALADG
jgi:glycosyltransferase involved in cell wall biosynthesis